MTFPRVQPIAPTWRKEPFDDPDWLFEFKYDGYRALCYIEPRRNRLISRNNNIMTRFDALADQVAAALEVDDAILDGEIIAPDETGRPVSSTLCAARARPPMSRSISFGSMAPICGPCRFTSAGWRCRPFCRRDRRSFPRRSPSRAGAASSSN